MASLLILYGSETGTAQDTAESLRREALLQALTVRLMGLDDYNIDDLTSETVVLFVVATTGQGEFPPNMRSAWRRLLRKSLPTEWLSKVRFGVLGLGDSSYQKYNFAGKKLFRRLVQLGGRPLTDLGLADDQHELGIDGALVPWKQAAWAAIRESRIFEQMTSSFDQSSALPPRFSLDYSCSRSNQIPGIVPDYYEVTVTANERVTSSDHFQDTRLVGFSLDNGLDTLLSYNPGDVLMVRPFNLDETVAIAIEALGYDDATLDAPFVIRPNDNFTMVPPTWLIGEVTTLRTCFRKLFDLQMIPKKSFFEVLGSISQDEMEREKLLELASPQGLDDFLDYCVRCRRSVAETLRDFPITARSISPPRLFDLFCQIRPRAFSIASSRQAQPDVIQILVAKVQYKSRMSEPRRGLCSSFISRLSPGSKVFVKIRAGTFRFPSSNVPVMCIGPGTGIAPFRSYLSFRQSQAPAVANSILFFGCRGRTKDFYFEAEWSTLSTTTVYTAFSRDDAEKKTYVQHLIEQYGDEVWECIRVNGMIFVAGSAGAMPRDVAAAIDTVAEEPGFCQRMEAQGRMQYETWS